MGSESQNYEKRPLAIGSLLYEHICDVPGDPMLARFAPETDTLPSFDYRGLALTRRCVLSMMFSSEGFFPALNSASSVALSEPAVSTPAD
jgi:hypothetical protein